MTSRLRTSLLLKKYGIVIDDLVRVTIGYLPNTKEDEVIDALVKKRKVLDTISGHIIEKLDIQSLILYSSAITTALCSCHSSHEVSLSRFIRMSRHRDELGRLVIAKLNKMFISYDYDKIIMTSTDQCRSCKDIRYFFEIHYH